MIQIVKYIKLSIIWISVALVFPLAAVAANAVTYNADIGIDTSDTAEEVIITVTDGLLITRVSVMPDYVDLTLDSGSSLSLSVPAGYYLNFAKQSGTDLYTIGPTCVRQSATITATDNIVLRVTVDTVRPTCSSGGSSTPPPTPATYTVTLTSPNGGETYTQGETAQITWRNDGTSSILNTNLYYSVDNGLTYTEIVKNYSSGTSYAWKIPEITSRQMLVKVERTDLVDILAFDTSDSVFHVDFVGEVDEPTEPEDIGDSTDSEIDTLNTGDLVKGTGDTVFYINNQGERQPFPNVKTFFSRYNDFSKVKDVSDELLREYPVGQRMTYAPGVRMLKMPDDPRVYYVSENDTLRLVPDEQTAQALYGTYWMRYIDDISSVFFIDYVIGDPIDLSNLPKLPFNISDETHTGVTLYENVNYGGVYEVFTSDDPDLRDNPIKNDTASSIQIDDGIIVYLYEHINFLGKEEMFTSSDADFSQRSIGDNAVSSIKIQYEDASEIPSTELACATAQPFTASAGIGTFSEEVRSLQTLLQCLGYFPPDITPTRYFGTITETSVMKFQDAFGIDPVGIVGPVTREQLNAYVQ